MSTDEIEPNAELSVVVACVEAARSIDGCLHSILASTAGLDAEVLVVDASRDDTATRARRVAAVQVMRAPHGSLVPELWAQGFRQARGRVVVFTTGHFEVSPGWARALLKGLSSGAAGVAGAIALAPASRVGDWAVCFLRYSLWLREPDALTFTDGEIPGDNAAYVRAALDRHADTFDEGFWEVDFHQRARAQGAGFAMTPDATASLGRSVPLRWFVGHRYRHGRRSGAWRAAQGLRSCWAIAASAPLVPFVLLLRCGRRAWQVPSLRARFLAASPIIVLFATAWAAGEAVGALVGTVPRRESQSRTTGNTSPQRQQHTHV